MKPENIQKQKIRIGSRESRLAQIQVKEVLSLLAAQGISLDFESVFFKTKGDQDKTTPLTTNPADDFFTDALDRNLLDNQIDIAVHSAKDLPKSLRPGLEIFALTPSLDETDAFVGKARFSDLKPGAKVGTSSVLRQEALKKLNPNIQLIDIRGTIEERIALVERGLYDGLVAATAALKRLGLEHLIKDIFSWEATALQGQLAVVGRSADSALKELFSRIDVRRGYGKVTLVGAGPGDPQLITLKGIKALKQADCVFYDYLISKDLLLYAVKAEKIYVGKRKGDHTLDQNELSKMLRQKAIAGKNVVRLKGGDPLIFGRGADETEYLRNYHIRVEIIPGVSSATGIPSLLGVPLTARGISSSVAFMSGHGESEQDERAQLLEIPKVDTIIFLMGLTKLPLIIASLKKSGWLSDKPIMIVSKGTLVDERIVTGTLDTIEMIAEREKLEPPALIVAGDVIKFWQKNSVTQEEKILYVGTNPEKYKSLGRIVHFPMIEIEEAQHQPQEIQKLIEELLNYHLILFTSRFGVHYFMKLITEAGIPSARLSKIDMAVVGEETYEALDIYDLRASLVSSVETSEGFLQALRGKYNLKDKKILFPRSSLPNPFLKDQLSQLGAMVKEFIVYQNKKPIKKDLPPVDIQKVIFTSPSTVKNFLEDYGKIPAAWRILSKGPHTKKALEDYGYRSEVLIYE